MTDPSIVRFRAVVEAGLAALEARREEVNDLNVFPVADGDTGDNMVLTLNAVLQELDRLSNAAEGRTIDEIGRDEIVASVARAPDGGHATPSDATNQLVAPRHLDVCKHADAQPGSTIHWSSVLPGGSDFKRPGGNSTSVDILARRAQGVSCVWSRAGVRSQPQPLDGGHEETVRSEPPARADQRRRDAPARIRVHALPEGREGSQGALATLASTA